MDDSHTNIGNQTFHALLRYGLSCCLIALLLPTPDASAQIPEAVANDEQPAAEPESFETPAQVEETQRTCGCCRGAKGQDRSSGASQGAGCGKGRGRRGAGGAEDPPRSHGGRPEMQLAHYLIENHQRLQRSVELIQGGVRTRTTTDDAELVETLRQHVQQMASLIHDGGRIRNWDPLFREIFDHRESIEIEIDNLDNGVEVVETSDDDAVALLIQAHAKKVDEFVARGRAAYREETPLPDGYSKTSP